MASTPNTLYDKYWNTLNNVQKELVFLEQRDVSLIEQETIDVLQKVLDQSDYDFQEVTDHDQEVTDHDQEVTDHDQEVTENIPAEPILDSQVSSTKEPEDQLQDSAEFELTQAEISLIYDIPEINLLFQEYGLSLEAAHSFIRATSIQQALISSLYASVPVQKYSDLNEQPSIELDDISLEEATSIDPQILQLKTENREISNSTEELALRQDPLNPQLDSEQFDNLTQNAAINLEQFSQLNTSSSTERESSQLNINQESEDKTNIKSSSTNNLILSSTGETDSTLSLEYSLPEELPEESLDLFSQLEHSISMTNIIDQSKEDQDVKDEETEETEEIEFNIGDMLPTYRPRQEYVEPGTKKPSKLLQKIVVGSSLGVATTGVGFTVFDLLF